MIAFADDLIRVDILCSHKKIISLPKKQLSRSLHLLRTETDCYFYRSTFLFSIVYNDLHCFCNEDFNFQKYIIKNRSNDYKQFC